MSDRERIVNEQHREIEELEERIAIILEGQPEVVTCGRCIHYQPGKVYECKKRHATNQGPDWYCGDGKTRRARK